MSDEKPITIIKPTISKQAAEPIAIKMLRFDRPIDLPGGMVPEGIMGRVGDELKNTWTYRINLLPWMRQYHIACYGPSSPDPQVRFVHESHVLFSEPA